MLTAEMTCPRCNRAGIFRDIQFKYAFNRMLSYELGGTLKWDDTHDDIGSPNFSRVSVGGSGTCPNCNKQDVECVIQIVNNVLTSVAPVDWDTECYIEVHDNDEVLREVPISILTQPTFDFSKVIYGALVIFDPSGSESTKVLNLIRETIFWLKPKRFELLPLDQRTIDLDWYHRSFETNEAPQGKGDILWLRQGKIRSKDFNCADNPTFDPGSLITDLWRIPDWNK